MDRSPVRKYVTSPSSSFLTCMQLKAEKRPAEMLGTKQNAVRRARGSPRSTPYLSHSRSFFGLLKEAASSLALVTEPPLSRPSIIVMAVHASPSSSDSHMSPKGSIVRKRRRSE